MKNFRIATSLILLTLLALSGCLATTNILTDGSLDSSDYKIAQTMGEMTTRYCITFRSRNDGSNRSNEMPVKAMPEFKRFYAGSNNWYKADVLTENGTWTSIYYNAVTNNFTCGNSWDEYSESRTVQFTRKDIKEKSINDSRPTQLYRATQTTFVESKLNEVKSLFQKDLITSQQYDEQVKRILENQ